MDTRSPQPKLLVVVGETASGKSDLTFKIAQDFEGEIIAADSWTVYKGFDIGTSKPSKTDQKLVKHYLLDVVEAPDGFNAPKFKDLANDAIKDIQNRGKLPILVGGTGLYIDSLLYDFGFLPDMPAIERAELNALTIEELLQKAKSEKIDLTGIDIRNKRRIIRAIEAKGQKPTRGKLKPNTLIVGLKIDNDELRQRIQKRTEQMIKNGLEQEVKRLAGKYGWDAEPMKGIGYREWQNYFAGKQTLEETKQKIISSTLGLAKRQWTWFKRDQNIHWFSSINDADSFIRQVLST